MKRLLLLALTAVLAGCTTPPDYQRDGASAEQQARDRSECNRQVEQANPSMCDEVTLLSECMRSRGYSPIIGTGRWGAFCP
jgi:starvation-inducible outer membrane lipoprotein